MSLAEVVDLARYPIDDLEGAAGRALVARCRTELETVGASDLEGFMRPDAIAAVVEWALTARPKAFRTETTHNVYFTADDPELPPDDPRHIRVRSAKSGLAYDDIPADSPLRVAYESDELTAFVAAALGGVTLYRHADPLGALNVMFYEEGDELGWHFDNADSVVTLMLQPGLDGGAFEYSPMLRGPNDENHDGVRSLLQGERSGVRSMSGAPGTLALFRGHWSPHHVTPVVGSTPRINAVLSYADTTDAALTDYTKEMFYGRTA